MTEDKQQPQDVLREEILTDARRQAERALKRARKEADGIAETAAAELEAWRTGQIDLAKAEAQRRSEMILAGLAVETGRMHSNRIESLLQSIYDEVRQRLVSRDGMDYRQTLINLAAEAIRKISGSRVAITLSKSDRNLLGDKEIKAIKQQAGRPDVELEIDYDPESRDAGPIVHGEAGNEFWDNRLTEKLERLWPALRREIALQAALVETVESKGNVS